jgi:hypothetical protein
MKGFHDWFRKNIIRPFVSLALVFSSIALFSCSFTPNVLDAQGDTDRTTGSISISFGDSQVTARTVTADFALNVSEWTIVLTRADGAIRTVTSAAPVVTVNGLVPGSWDIAVTGRDAARVVLFTGSVSGIAITASGTVPVTVPVSSVATGNGTLRLTVTVPYDTNIGSATASIDGGVFTSFPVDVDDIAQTRTIVFEASLSPGAHTLVFNLYRGTAQDTLAGTYIEAVNIYSGIVSDRWIAADGTLLTVRALGGSDLISTDRQLGNITLEATQACFGGNAGFVPGTTFPLAQTVFTGTYPVDLRPVEAVAGQRILYSYVSESATAPGTGTPILSGNPVTVNAPGTTVWFRVISPNGDPDWYNVYQIYVDNNFVQYNSPPSSLTESFIPPYTLHPYSYFPWPVVTVFNGWNTASDGSGTPYPDGYTFTTAIHLELYAQWQTSAATAALTSIAAQLALGNGNVSIPADFTANDLYALAALIDPPYAYPVTLDMSTAVGITQIPASVFNGCVALVAVHVSSAITSIGSQAFAGTGMVTVGAEGFDFICDALYPPALGFEAFGFDPVNDCKVHVPAGSVDAYKADADWSLLDIHQIPP